MILRLLIVAAILCGAAKIARAETPPTRCEPTRVAEFWLSMLGYGLLVQGFDYDGDQVRIYKTADGRWLYYFLPRSQAGAVMCRQFGGPALELENEIPARGA